ncbi:hypothetical protein GQ42DRAFT_159831 [Ramicandelaber brevisporus]|nr:hypothetical protein GQ42DRAFT_159831 [Ramicandelaber brevisporus]
MGLSDGFLKLKQWTTDKIGGGERALEGTDEARRLDDETESRRFGTNNFRDAMVLYCTQIDKRKKSSERSGGKVTPLENLASTMSSLGGMLDGSMVYSQQLTVLGEAEAAIAAAHADFAQIANEEYLPHLDKAYDDLREYNDLKGRFATCKKDLAQKQMKARSATKEQTYIEEDLRASKARYDEAQHDVIQKMITIVDNDGQNVVDLQNFYQSQLAYYKAGYEALQAIEQEMNRLAAVRIPTAHERFNFDALYSDRPRVTNTGTIRQTPTNTTATTTASDAPPPMPTRRQTAVAPASEAPPPMPARRNSPRQDDSDDDDSWSVASRADSMRRPSVATSPPAPALPKRNVPAPPPPEEPKKVQRKVLFDFTAEDETELSLIEGDIITVINQDDPGWWMGLVFDSRTNQEYEGLFPVDYTEPYEEPKPEPPAPPAPAPAPARRPAPTPPAPAQAAEPSYPPPAYSEPAPPQPQSRPQPRPAVQPPAPAATPSWQRPAATSKPAYTPAPASSQQPVSMPTPAIPSAASKPSYSKPAHAPAPAMPSAASKPAGPRIPAPAPPPPTAAAAPAVGPCGECGCDDFLAHAFKKGVCSNCFHRH